MLLSGLLLAASGSAVSSAGQVLVPDEPVFIWRGIEEGLSHAAIHALLQDDAGFLWIGTAGGLNRFDGHEFRAFTHHPDSAHSLSDDHVRALARGANGRLWVGTERGGLDLFDPATGRSRRFELLELGPWATDAALPASQQRRGRTVSSIVPTHDGWLLLATDLGLVRFDPASGRAFRLDPAVVRSDPAGIPLCALPDGGVLAATPDGRISRLGTSANALVGVVEIGEPLTALHCHSADRVYAGTVRGNVFAVDLARRRAERVGAVDGENADSLDIHDVIPGPDGNLWIATGQGLFLMPPGVTHGRHVAQTGRGRLVDAQIHRFLIDRSGMLWIGTWNGLGAVHPASLSIRRLFNHRESASPPFGRGVVSVHVADSTQLWIGTYDAGVVVLGMTADGWIPEDVPALDPLAVAFVFDITPAPDGGLWIATLRDGIFRLDAHRRVLTQVPIESLTGDTAQPLLYSVFVDRSGDVWAGSETLGLLRYDAGRRVFTEYGGPADTFDFGSRYVWPIAEDASGNLWVGAFNGGVSRLDATRREQKLYGPGPGGLTDARILTVYPDSRGSVWIGTEGGGLQRLDPATGVFVRYTTADGLPHDNVEAVVEDASGALWISTSAGIARFEPESGVIQVLTESAGLAGDRFFANSVARTALGTLLFGGPDGVTIIDPARFRTSGFQPKMAITRFSIRGEETPLARIDTATGLDLGPQETFFALEFAAMDFRQPELTRYRYQLVGLDEDWIDSGARRIANYTSVPFRSYTFRVQAINADGRWSELLSLPIRVRPPYHRTWWFRSAVAAAIIALVAGSIAYRLRELHRRQDLRLGIAGKLHDDIGANLAAIALKTEMIGQATELDEKRRRQLADVGRLARDTTHQLRETVWVVNTQFDTLPGLIARMRDTAETILGGHVGYEFNSPAELPDRPLEMERRQSFYLVFKEALQNVLKHAGAQQVLIEVGYDARQLWCTIHDNGRGFDPSRAQAGNGLGLMRKRAQRHGGYLTVASAPGQGTTVGFRIRMK